jgi:hypothetical protein
MSSLKDAFNDLHYTVLQIALMELWLYGSKDDLGYLKKLVNDSEGKSIHPLLQIAYDTERVLL